ncbi:MAG: hypothetical protein KAS32_28590 [Candidatus Peribacteraceae bacterium]|nr:hypothetical protein [Candidatus Peribacteraceae bacterium]
MTEQEYCDVSDLQLLRSVMKTLTGLNDSNCVSEARVSLYIQITKLEGRVEKYVDND